MALRYNKALTYFVAFVGFCALAQESCAAGGIVMSTHRRLAVITTAEQVLANRQTDWRTAIADLPDPFYRPNVAEQAKADGPPSGLLQAPARADIDVLESVAPKIRPTGTMLIGNEQYLLLAGKRFREGDQISVTFDGLVYRLAITSIERNSYTLRLNNDELQRDFK